jgi:squalene-hopene/tetraprenyl-beta-curcumene cyclase
MDLYEAKRGYNWLLVNQNADGSWGGSQGIPGSIEETALALEVLADTAPSMVVERAADWLIGQVLAGNLSHPAPIGFYFAKLWYFEKLYPIIFTIAALGRLRHNLH